MPVTTRSQAKKQQELNTNVAPITEAKTKKVENTFDYLYKDEKGIEYISESQFEERCNSDIKPNLEDIQHKLPKKLGAYKKITEIFPSYLENLPEHIKKKNLDENIYAIPPKGFAWTAFKQPRQSWYFDGDDEWVLVRIPIRKRRC